MLLDEHEVVDHNVSFDLNICLVWWRNLRTFFVLWTLMCLIEVIFAPILFLIVLDLTERAEVLNGGIYEID